MIGLSTPFVASAIPIDTGSFSPGGSGSSTSGPTIPGTPPAGSWQTSEVSLSVAEGTVGSTELTWLPQGTPRGELRWNLSGNLAEVADLQAGTQTESGAINYPLTVTLPPAAQAEYSGTVQFVDDGGPFGPEAHVTVYTDFGDSENIPGQLTHPTPERVVVFEDAERVADELLVTVDASDPDSAIRNAARTTGALIVGADQESGLYQLRYRDTSPEEIESLKEIVNSVPGIAHTSSNYVGYSTFHFSDIHDPGTPSELSPEEWEFELNALANDELLQPWMSQTEHNWPLQQINAPMAWGPLEGSPSMGESPHWGVLDYDNTKVGIIDVVPLYTQHEDLQNPAARSARVGNNKDYDQERGSHATHVSGIACAEVNNNKGIAGVARSCDIRDYYSRSEASGPNFTFLSSVSKAMERAGKDGARVVNISVGFSPKTAQSGPCRSGNDDPPLTAFSRNEIQKQLASIVRKYHRTLWVASAGNSCTDAANNFPAALAGHTDSTVAHRVVSVAATTRAQELAPYSNFGNTVSIAAPGGRDADGERVISTTVSCQKLLWLVRLCSSGYGSNFGTSMAAPYVTGTAALGFNAQPETTPEEMKHCLTEAPKDFQPRWVTSPHGHQHLILDARATIVCVMGGWKMPS